MGLDFMLRPKDTVQKAETTLKDNPQEVQVEAEEVIYLSTFLFWKAADAST